MPNVNFTGFKRIVADPEYCDGQPRIEGTRITVGAILSYLAGGMNVEQIVEAYPKLSSEDVYEVVGFGACQLLFNAASEHSLPSQMA